MKRKYWNYLAASFVGVGLLGTGVASACGFGFGSWGASSLTPDEIITRQQTAFEQQAQILGLSVDEIKAAWAEGKTMKEIMEEKGISQDAVQQRIQDQQAQQLKTQLQTLVDRGVITQEQADQRLQFMQNQLQNGSGKRGMKMFHRGWGMGMF